MFIGKRIKELEKILGEVILERDQLKSELERYKLIVKRQAETLEYRHFNKELDEKT